MSAASAVAQPDLFAADKNCHVGSRYFAATGAKTGIMAPGVAFDYFTNSASRSGWGTNSLTEDTSYELIRLSYNYWLMITLYRNHWLMRKIVDVPARDMVKAWPRVISDMPPEDSKRIEKIIKQTQLKRQVASCLRWARLFGGAGALMVIDGQEDKLDQPLDLDSIGPGQFRGLIPFDRWSGIMPSAEIETDFRKPLHFNLPKAYQVYSYAGVIGFNVHASRILRFVGPTVPQPELQAQSYWGISIYEIVYEELRKRDNMSWNLLNMSYRANLIGMTNPDLASMMSGLGMNQNALVGFQARMQALNQMMSNQSLLILPKDGQMSNVSYAFGGLPELYMQFQLDVAGAADIPVTRLYGRTLTGLAQSNDADERIYEERIAADQSEQMQPVLEGQLYPVLAMSTLGEIPGDMDLRFPSIRVLDEKEKSELAKSTSDTIIGLFNAGIIDKPTALKEIQQTSDITEVGTNITDEMIEEAEAAIEQAAAIPGWAEPGEGGEPGAPGQPGAAPGGGPGFGGNATGAARKQAFGGRGPRAVQQAPPGRPKVALGETGNPLRVAAADASRGVVLFDLDRTLAEYDGDVTTIGAPIPRMVEKLHREQAVGNDVRIFTARVADDPDDKQRAMIDWWAQKHLGGSLPITNAKDTACVRLYDDIAVSPITPRKWNGMDLTIEYDAGERRRFENDRGVTVYDRVLEHPYGFINGTTGRDGDEIDCIVGPDDSADTVFVADMVDLGPDVDKRDDEDKVLLGFADEEAARDAFLTMYPPEFLGRMGSMTVDEFKAALGDAGNYQPAELFDFAFDGVNHTTDEFRESEHPRGSGETR